MTTHPSQRDHLAGIIEALAATGRPIGDGIAPTDRELPYAVVFDLSGATFDGSLSDPDADIELPYQVTCIGETAEQARWMFDKVAVALLAGVTVDGRSVTRNLPVTGGGALRRDDATSEKLFYLTPQWRLFTVPA